MLALLNFCKQVCLDLFVSDLFFKLLCLFSDRFFGMDAGTYQGTTYRPSRKTCLLALEIFVACK